MANILRLLATIRAAYPGFMASATDSDRRAAVKLWELIIGDASDKDVDSALKTYIVRDTKGFAPTPGQIVQYLPQSDAVRALPSPQKRKHPLAIVTTARKRLGLPTSWDYDRRDAELVVAWLESPDAENYYSDRPDARTERLEIWRGIAKRWKE